MHGGRLIPGLSLVGAADLSGSNDSGNAFTSLFLPMLGVLFVVVLAYVFTKWFLKKYQGYSAGNYIRVIERVPVAQDKMLLLVEVNKQAYLLGIAGQTITTVCSFEAGELPPKQAEPPIAFKSILEETFKKNLPFYKQGAKNGDGETKGK